MKRDKNKIKSQCINCVNFVPQKIYTTESNGLCFFSKTGITNAKDNCNLHSFPKNFFTEEIKEYGKK